jgi:hypothetical protein
VESIQSISGSRQTGSHSDKPARNNDFCGIAYFWLYTWKAKIFLEKKEEKKQSKKKSVLWVARKAARIRKAKPDVES